MPPSISVNAVSAMPRVTAPVAPARRPARSSVRGCHASTRVSLATLMVHPFRVGARALDSSEGRRRDFQLDSPNAMLDVAIELAGKLVVHHTLSDSPKVDSSNRCPPAPSAREARTQIGTVSTSILKPGDWSQVTAVSHRGT